jgi:hypothetical protein
MIEPEQFPATPQDENHLTPPVISAPPERTEPAETRFLKWLVLGSHGVRVGWLVALLLVLSLLFTGVFGIAIVPLATKVLHIKLGEISAASMTVSETLEFLGLLAAAFVCALIERRKVLDYNLRGRYRLLHFVTGMVGGFITLSALAGALYYGGWLHFGGVSLTGTAVVQAGALWGAAFLLTGFYEEGLTRCYMLYTLTRGLNYWWALGTVASFSFFAYLNTHGSGAGGIYLMAGLGVIPCLLLHLRKSPASGFWEAAWLTSTFFGYIHTFNKGETWIGIFSAAAIGFVFCVSVRLTGSAWWAIGFHAAWDWAQTFFYGTADSGFQPKGHYLTTTPVGAEFWSGGSAGPEGSVLILPTVLLTLLVLVLIYGRKRASDSASPLEQAQLS